MVSRCLDRGYTSERSPFIPPSFTSGVLTRCRMAPGQQRGAMCE